MVVVAIVVALVTGILYLILGQSDIPVKDYEVRKVAANEWPCRGAFGFGSFFCCGEGGGAGREGKVSPPPPSRSARVSM